MNTLIKLNQEKKEIEERLNNLKIEIVNQKKEIRKVLK